MWTQTISPMTRLPLGGSVPKSMIRSSRHGPRGARVERVQVYEEEPAGSQEFRVLG